MARFCSWLCGRNPKGFSTIEESISKRLPQGLTIQKATAEEIAQALQSAIITSGHQPEAIIKFVFSQFTGRETAKAEVVIRAVIPVISPAAIAGFVRTAARARPSLGLTVARTATAMVPEQSERIANALESVIAGAALDLLGASADKP